MTTPSSRPLLGDHLSSAFIRRVVVVASGQTMAYDPAAWSDAIVIVEDGAIEVECLAGIRQRFERGDILCLEGLPLRAIHSDGEQPAVLIAVSRTATGS